MILPAEIWRTAFAPPDRRSIEDWAHENVTLPPVLTKRGKFSVEDSRHFIAPLQALRHDRVRGVRILAPVRGGKTLIADVAVPWAIANDNAAIQWTFNDDDLAKEHAELRQWPILLNVPAIRAMLPLNKNHQRAQEIIFGNGLPLFLQGPAIGGLQGRGFKWVVCDEPWLYKSGILQQAKARMGDFVKNASNKFLAISQGGEEEGDWDFEFRAGVLFLLHVECAGCHEYIAPEWTLRRPDTTYAGAVFETIKYPDGTYDKDASAATVRFVCPKCGHAHPNTEKTRAEWNRTCKYVNPKTGEGWNPENPPTEVSFRWHALIDYPWAELVKEWLSAQEAKHVGSFAPLVIFFQKRCALMRSERTVHETDLPFARFEIAAGLNPAEKSWPGEVARALTADRQAEDTYWVTVRAWSDKTGESRRLWFGKLYSEADIEAKRIEYGVNKDCVVIDSGYKPKGDHGVYAACIRYGWIAAKGTDEPYFWHMIPQPNGKPPLRVQKPWAPITYGDPGEGTSAEGRTRCPLIRFSAPVMADRVNALITRGLWVEPAVKIASEMEREYAVQMSAEFKRPRVNKFSGKREMVYVCPSGNNHAFDCSKMQILFAMVARGGLLPSGIEQSNSNEHASADKE